MRLHRRVLFLATCSLFWLVSISQGAGADHGAPALSLDLTTALERALRENPDLKAKRQALGIAQGRVQQAELLFQDNPRLTVIQTLVTGGLSHPPVDPRQMSRCASSRGLYPEGI